MPSGSDRTEWATVVVAAPASSTPGSAIPATTSAAATVSAIRPNTPRIRRRAIRQSP
jgi:hypothetical protein